MTSSRTRVGISAAACLAAGGVATAVHRRRSGYAEQGYELSGELDVGAPDFLRALEALTGAPVSEGNDLRVLINGDEIFPIVLETIAAAKKTLNLLTFVYWRGEIAVQVAEAVSERSRAGVRCNVLLDAFGAARMDARLVQAMQDAGVRVEYFRPIKPYTLTKADHRTHRKVIVADGSVGMTGGVGIATEWTGNAQDPNHWRDTHVRVSGPVVRALQGAFLENWLEATGELLAGDDYLPELDPVADGAPMQVVVSGPGVNHTNTEAMYFLAIASARHTIQMTTAYFAPRPMFVEALRAAARRGVDVQIIVPGPHIDKQVVRSAGRAVYAPLLEAGISIYEYQPTMLHAKTLVIDGRWCSIGSANFDNRSFALNDEATLCVQSTRVTDQLAHAFENDRELSLLIQESSWTWRSPHHRIAEAGARLLRREL
jgi:cardiolipin synthase A/B